MNMSIAEIEKHLNPTTQLHPACEVFFSGAIDTPGGF